MVVFPLTKKEILYWILTNLKDNWVETGTIDGYKPYAITYSEMAADSLSEILYDLRIEEKTEDSILGDYKKTTGIDRYGRWYTKFEEV